MNEETLGMIVGFVIVAPIAAFVVYRMMKRRSPAPEDRED